MEYIELEGDAGQRWRFRYPMRALRWLETQTGEAFQQTFDALGNNEAGLTEQSLMVAAALYHENPDVTLDDADEVLESVGYVPTLAAVMEAVEKSALIKGLSEEDQQEFEQAKANAQKNVRGTGTRRKKKQPA